MRDRPSRDFMLMQSALLWGMRGTCSRADVGVVISRDGRTLSSGYNGAPSGMPHCNHSCNCDHLEISHRSDHEPDCRKIQPCKNVVHAEANAIAFAARHGVGINGAELHTTRVPCLNCAGMIINAGIIRVVWREEHREMEGLLRLMQAELQVVKYDE